MAAVGQQSFARFNIVCGTNGTGKSTFVSKVIANTHHRDVLVYIEDIDTYGNPFNLPTVPFFKYKGGKVTINADEINFESFLTAVVKQFRNGMLVIDEAGMYNMFAEGKPIQPLLNLMKQRRKYNIEVYFIYHGLSEINVKLFKWTNNLILFHQTDEFKHKAAVIPRIEELKAAKDRISKQYFSGNVHYAERVQLS